jgi:hypothetical protein
LKIIFLNGDIYLSFHNSSFALRYFFLKCKWQGHNVTHPMFQGGRVFDIILYLLYHFILFYFKNIILYYISTIALFFIY